MPGAAYGLPPGEKRRLRYVSLAGAQIAAVPDASTTAISIAQTHTAEMTALPTTGVVGVALRILALTSAIHAGNALKIHDYGVATQVAQCFCSGVATYITEQEPSFVKTGGIRNRQIDYGVDRSAGTITYYIRVVGYWTEA